MDVKRNLLIFLQLLRRDFYVYSKIYKKYLLNYTFIYPSLVAFCFGYIWPNVGILKNDSATTTMVLLGTGLTATFSFAFQFNLGLLFDFKEDRFIDYQILLLRPRLIALERIFFTSIVTFVNVFPIFPMFRLLIGDYFDLSKICFYKFFIILYLGSFFCCAFNFWFTCYLKDPEKISNFWIRFNFPLIQFGGFLYPWYVISGASKFLGKIVLINPLIYITEGLRTAVLGGDKFFPFLLSFFVLIGYSIIFIFLGFYFFKKKTDHI